MTARGKRLSRRSIPRLPAGKLPEAAILFETKHT
jgi:hypothetical protein